MSNKIAYLAKKWYSFVLSRRIYLLLIHKWVVLARNWLNKVKSATRTGRSLIKKALAGCNVYLYHDHAGEDLDPFLNVWLREQRICLELDKTWVTA